MSTSFSAFQGAMAGRDAQTESQITRTDDRMKKAHEATLPGHSVLGQAGQAMLPAKLTRDDQDENRRILELPQVAQELGYRQPVGDQQLAEYIQRKRQDARFVDREKWIAKRFDLSSPEKAAWFNQIMPSFLERRKRFGEAKLAMQKQLFDIVLYGPQSEEDLDFLFAIDNGSIDLAELKRPIWEAVAQETDRAAYQAGMFAQRGGVAQTLATAQANQQGYGYGNSIGVGANRMVEAGAANMFPNMNFVMSGNQGPAAIGNLDI